MAGETWVASVVYTTIPCSSSTDVTTCYVWPAWNQSYTDATTSPAVTVSHSTQTVWVNWNEWFVAYEAYQETVEQRALREQAIAQEQERQRLAYEEQNAKAAAAKASAEALLLGNLDEAQAADFQKSRHFVVHSRDGERRYRVEYGISGNVKLLGEQDRVVASFCIHPDIRCPTEDVMLAQKLLLECDEAQFLKTANRRAA